MLAYGNPTRNYLPELGRDTYLDSLLGELASYPFPNYNGQDVIDEINKLIQLTNSLESDEDLKKRYEFYDENFDRYMVDVLANLKVASRESLNDLIQDVKSDILPLILKLKYHYQRVRPSQLSYLLTMKLYAYPSNFALSPSYPSGHAIQSKVYADVLSARFPKYHHQLQDLAKDISQSRMALGLHYESDCIFAEYVSELIVTHPEFQKKYKL